MDVREKLESEMRLIERMKMAAKEYGKHENWID